MSRSSVPPIALTPPSPQQRRRHDLLLAGLDLLDQAIAVFDVGPHLVTWNKALLRLLDFPPSLLKVGMPFEDLVRFNASRGEYGDGDIDKLVAERMAYARAFQPHYMERVRPNGRILAVKGIPIPNLGFISLWTDITDQRRYETLIQKQNTELEQRVSERTHALEQANAEIQQIAGALRQSEERLLVILDALPAFISHVDAQQRYRFVNRGYAEWFHCSKADILGNSIAEVVGKEVYPLIQQKFAKAAAGERVSYEYARTNAQGHVVHARSVMMPDFSIEGRFLGCYILSIDITEQKASEAALAQAQKMEAVGQLTGGLAHDFNNLLSIIIGNLSALEEHLSPEDDARQYTSPALGAARRGAELIKRLLSFSRQQTLQPQLIEINQLVSGMMQLFKHTLSENICIRLDLPAEPIYTHADPHQLENALLNLALNSRDAMPDGGNLSLRVSRRHIPEQWTKATDLPAGHYVQIDVSDSGKGITPDALPKVFEPFFTTKPFGQSSGLGLSMVYGFVRQSGGNIRVQSLLGQGATITFVLPLADPPTKHSNAPQTHSATPASVKNNNPLVLLVEDNPEVRRVVRLQLSALNFPVLEAATGPEALQLLQSVSEIGILLSDTIMPGGMSGHELAQAAREHCPELPILLMTGYTEQAALTPTFPLLKKPFEQTILAQALAAIQNSAH